MRRSRLVPGRGGSLSGRLGPIIGGGMIDVDARHRERAIEVIIGGARRAGRTGTPPSGSGELNRALRDVRPVAKRQLLTACGGAPVDADERVQAGWVDQHESGQIDDQAHLTDRSSIKLVIEQRDGRAIKRAT